MAQRFTVLHTRFRRLAVLTARGTVLVAWLSVVPLTLAIASLTLPTATAALLAAVLDRLGFNGRVRFIPDNHDVRDLSFR